MPRFDRSGPNGEGAMTGRKNGLCTGNTVEDSRMNYGSGRGRGRFSFSGSGFGMRLRGGYGNQSMREEVPAEEEKQLKDEISSMKKQMLKLENILEKLLKADK